MIHGFGFSIKEYQKHYPPYPSHQVWRLEMIGRNGAFHNCLSKECICTVKDFVAILHINFAWLKEILGPKMYPKSWDTVVNHAMTFKSDTSVCFSYTPNFQQETTVMFNIMGQLMGLIVERTFITVDELSETEKVDAHKLVVSALEHWNEVKSVDNLTISLMGGSNLTVIECATGHNFETNDIDLYVNTQPATSSTSIMSPRGTTGAGNLDNTSGQPSSFQYANSMIWEPFDIFSSEPFFHSDDIDIYGNTQPDMFSASTRHLDHTSGQPSSFQGANYLQ